MKKMKRPWGILLHAILIVLIALVWQSGTLPNAAKFYLTILLGLLNFPITWTAWDLWKSADLFKMFAPLFFTALAIIVGLSI